MLDIILFILALFIYFIPTIIAWNKRNSDAILAINLFLGWTFIGWVVALAWAFSKDSIPQIVQQTQTEDNFDKIKKLKQLLDSGAITQDEYEAEKSKLLRSSKSIPPHHL